MDHGHGWTGLTLVAQDPSHFSAGKLWDWWVQFVLNNPVAGVSIGLALSALVGVLGSWLTTRRSWFSARVNAIAVFVVSVLGLCVLPFVLNHIPNR
jgi:NhaP-type Na+/H+ or K+/H+ antiporter